MGRSFTVISAFGKVWAAGHAAILNASSICIAFLASFPTIHFKDYCNRENLGIFTFFFKEKIQEIE